ncbi:MAG: formate dehydrogenase accessory sulfurtransferase FdhD [Candidatus Thalassarchaeaceae archaeon]|tara:strand:- start:4938 stop:5729 length:792 start_codon:yes stop_codon:yes gene_type:complete
MDETNQRPGIKYSIEKSAPTIDSIAVEIPLQTTSDRNDRKLYGTLMRTPGKDMELIIGLMISSGDLLVNEQIPEVTISSNIVHVAISNIHSERLLNSTSSCGICGRENIEIVPIPDCGTMPKIHINSDIIRKIIQKIGNGQDLFQSTGGTHAAALWNLDGEMLSIMEDVGRHNAFDKLIGHQRIIGQWPMSTCIVSLSGRISYEMVEKAIRSNVPILISVGSATTAAIDLASFHDLTLIVFARDHRFTCMTGTHRIINADDVK